MTQASKNQEIELQAERKLLIYIIEAVSSVSIIDLHEALETTNPEKHGAVMEHFDRGKNFKSVIVNDSMARQYKDTLEGIISGHKDLIPYYYNGRTEELKRFFDLNDEHTARFYMTCVQIGVLDHERWEFLRDRIKEILDSVTKIEEVSYSDVLRKTPEKHVGDILKYRDKNTKFIGTITDKIELQKYSGELKHILGLFDRDMLLEQMGREDESYYLRLIHAGKVLKLWTIDTPLFDRW